MTTNNLTNAQFERYKTDCAIVQAMAEAMPVEYDGADLARLLNFIVFKVYNNDPDKTVEFMEQVLTMAREAQENIHGMKGVKQ